MQAPFAGLLIAAPHTPMAVTEGLKIPNLGESSTSLFSADYEYQLGRMWLRSFRGQAPSKMTPCCTVIWKAGV
ncbi:MAG: hypothetical protein CM15mP74_19760 [Halieaceae bacterium]|nr:MAG: hypothetical protein CM15mP74_19760 [Halieaceae bacterium]